MTTYSLAGSPSGWRTALLLGAALGGLLLPAPVRAGDPEKGWFAFNPKPDPPGAAGAIALRPLNEAEAGAGGFIGVRGGQFIHPGSGTPVRFWAVNGPAGKG